MLFDEMCSRSLGGRPYPAWSGPNGRRLRLRRLGGPFAVRVVIVTEAYLWDIAFASYGAATCTNCSWPDTRQTAISTKICFVENYLRGNCTLPC